MRLNSHFFSDMGATGMTPLIILCAMMMQVKVEELGLGEMVGPGCGWEEDVVQGVTQVVRRYLVGCHLVLVAPSSSSAVFPLIK